MINYTPDSSNVEYIQSLKYIVPCIVIKFRCSGTGKRGIAVNKLDVKGVRYHYSRYRVTIVWSLWRHQRSIVTSSAERKPSKWDTATMCKDRRFIVIDGCVISRNKIMYVLSWWTTLSLESYFGKKKKLSWALKQFVTRVHTLFSMNCIWTLLTFIRKFIWNAGEFQINIIPILILCLAWILSHSITHFIRITKCA